MKQESADHHRIDWGLCAVQASLYGATQVVFATSGAIRLALDLHVVADLVPLLSFSALTWLLNGLILAAGAQWAMARPAHGAWRALLVVITATVLQGPLNEVTLSVAAQPFFGDSMLPVASGFYVLWNSGLGGSLLLAYCVLLQRSRRRRQDLADAEYQRSQLEARVREARAGNLERSIDPALLEQSLHALCQAYRRDRVTGESLLDALVECLRLTMPGIRDEATQPARATALHAWGQLRERLEEAFTVCPEPAAETIHSISPMGETR